MISPAIFFSLIINLITVFGGVILLDRGRRLAGAVPCSTSILATRCFRNSIWICLHVGLGVFRHRDGDRVFSFYPPEDGCITPTRTLDLCRNLAKNATGLPPRPISPSGFGIDFGHRIIQPPDRFTNRRLPVPHPLHDLNLAHEQ